MITSRVHSSGVAEVVMENPPVNALPVAGWQALADTLSGLGRDRAVRAVVLRAEGRGFNAGIDLKEVQSSDGHAALIAVNHACAEAFGAVYDCPVPVIAAVHGYCLGGGIGLVGNADIVVASSEASFGLPEVDRGALGAATHLSRLVPLQKMRAMVYTSERASASELLSYGSVHSVVEPSVLRSRAVALAEEIAAKRPAVIRAAKQSLNGIDLYDVRRSYRFEQGFTFELGLAGEGYEARSAFLSGVNAEPGAPTLAAQPDPPPAHE